MPSWTSKFESYFNQIWHFLWVLNTLSMTWYNDINMMKYPLEISIISQSVWNIKSTAGEYGTLNIWAPFNMKMTSYRYRKSHCGDNTVVNSSYLHNGISYTGKMTSLYWIRALYDWSKSNTYFFPFDAPWWTCHFLDVWTAIKISLKFVPRGPIPLFQHWFS